MDEEIEEILDDIEHFFLTASDAEREYWKLSPDERAQLPQLMRAYVDAQPEQLPIRSSTLQSPRWPGVFFP